MGNDLWDNQESIYFHRLSERMLEEHGGDWLHPVVVNHTEKHHFQSWEMIKSYTYKRYPMDILKVFFTRQWGFKNPRTTYTLPYWLSIFPNAKVINIYRNGMDVALSLWTRNKKHHDQGSPFKQELYDKIFGLKLWEQYVAQAAFYEPLLKDRMITLQYEKLVNDDADSVMLLEKFTGKSFREAIQKISERDRTGRYNLPEHQALREAAAQSEWMQKLGYI